MNNNTVWEKKKKRLSRCIFWGMIGLILAIYFFVSPINKSINNAVSLLIQGDLSALAAYIQSFGVWAMAVSFMLMILQSIIAPIPAFVITLSNAAVFGWWQGAMLSWSSAMVGAALCFYLARILGRDFVSVLTSKGALNQVDAYFERHGKSTIIICRLLPFIPFDLVSYGAGLTSIKFWPFFIATGIGQLPATIVYSYVGGTLVGGAQLLFIGLLSLFALFTLGFIMRSIYTSRHKNIEKSKKMGGHANG